MVNVLFVDDEVMVINAIRRSIKKQDFGKFYATSANEAMEIVKNNEIGVIISDMRMPKKNGLELMIEILAIDKDIVKIILSGYSQLPQIIAAINHVSIFKYIMKPWDLEEELLPAIEEGIEQYLSVTSIKQSKETVNQQNTLYKNMLNRYDDKILDVVGGMSKIAEMTVLITDYMKCLALSIGDASQENTALEFDAIKQFVRMYLDDAVANDKRFSVKNFMNMLDEFVKDCHSSADCKISDMINEGLSVSGKQATSRSIICTFLAKYLIKSTTDKVEVQLADKKVRDEMRLVVSITISCTSEDGQKAGNEYFELIHQLMIIDGGELVYKVFPEKLLMIFVLGKVELK